MEKLNVTWCYPDILNLHGDRGNLQAIERIGELLDVEVEITKKDNFEDEIDFENTDILIFNPGEIRVMEDIINALNKQKKALHDYIESGKIILVIGTSGSIFAKRIVRIDKGELIGLGYLDMICKERKKILGDDLVYKIKDSDMELTGSQIQVIDTKLNDDNYFADVIYGYGNNGYDTKKDGARYKNLIFTNMLGPILVKNPWFCEYLIKEAMKNKKITIDKILNEKDIELEIRAFKKIKEFNEYK